MLAQPPMTSGTQSIADERGAAGELRRSNELVAVRSHYNRSKTAGSLSFQIAIEDFNGMIDDLKTPASLNVHLVAAGTPVVVALFFVSASHISYPSLTLQTSSFQ